MPQRNNGNPGARLRSNIPLQTESPSNASKLIRNHRENDVSHGTRAASWICAIAMLIVATSITANAADRDLEARQVPLDIPRTASPVTVDAVLDEPAWQNARRTTLDFESWPAENIPARARTEAFVTYDDEQLYVAFIAHDPDPSLIRGHLSDRDDMFQDDFVGVVLDTFNDQRRGFEFFVNPLGVQGDLFQDDINQVEDPSFNAIWDSAGRITDDGYIVEMAIPFRSLRFRNGGNAQVWGIEFTRIYPRGERHQFRAYRADRNLACYLCEFQKYRGFEGADPGNNIEIAPTVTALHTRDRPEYGQPFDSATTDVEPGVDFRWGITPNVILNATLNPDFSQVEADSAQLDVNNQFALFFPERRPFFLEGQDLFDDVFGLVYTRNIADPDYGAKITGKEGAHAFGAFVTDDSRTNLLFPAAQGNEFESYDFESRNAAARYRFDLGPNSAVGALATKRESSNGYRNSVYAVDGVYRITQSDKLTAEVAGSQTEYPELVAADYEQPTGMFDGEAWHLSYDRNVREYFLYADYNHIGEGFRSDLGFVPQVGYEKSLLGGGYQWHGDEDAVYRRLKLNGDYDVTFDTDGQELERELEAYFSFSGEMQSYLETGVIRRRQFYDGVMYYQTLQTLFAEIKPSGSVSLGSSFRTGDVVDFANSRAARQLLIDPWVQLRIGQHWYVQLDPTWERLTVDGDTLYTARLVDLRSTWQFNTRMSIRWIAQYRDVTRNTALYVDEVDARSRNWGNQFMFSYKVNPRTLLYAGYSDGQEAIDGDPFDEQVQTVFVKLSYAWQL